jgi:predicted HTH transcriptional regulator
VIIAGAAQAKKIRPLVWRTVQTAANTSVETSVETPQVPIKTPEAILALLSAQPAMTLSQVASRLGKGTRAIEMAVAKLTESGKLQYVGPKKGGRWEVM